MPVLYPEAPGACLMQGHQPPLSVPLICSHEIVGTGLRKLSAPNQVAQGQGLASLPHIPPRLAHQPIHPLPRNTAHPPTSMPAEFSWCTSSSRWHPCANAASSLDLSAATRTLGFQSAPDVVSTLQCSVETAQGIGLCPK